LADCTDGVVRRILVIDDNPEIHGDFRTILQGAVDTSELDALGAALFGGSTETSASATTYRLDFASQGEEGLEQVKHALADGEPYHLAFVDMRMPPGWDGLETIERVWQVDPALQVVICTAYSDHSWEDVIRRLGATDKLLILKKPFDTVEVAQIASTMTEKWLLSRQASLKIEEMDRKVDERTRQLAATNEALELSNARLQESIAEAGQMASRAEAAHAELRQIFDTATDGILVIDKELKVLRANRTLCDMLGMTPEEAVGKTCSSVLPHAECGTSDCPVRRILAGEEQVELDMGLHADNGGRLFCTTTAAPYQDADNQVVGVLCTIRDVTERRTMETQLRHAQKLESIGQLAAGIAHEINTPTQYVGDNTRFLQEAFEDLMRVVEKHGELVRAVAEGGAAADVAEQARALAEDVDLDYLNQEIPSAIDQSLEGVARVAKIVRAMKEFSHPGGDEKTRLDLNRAIETTITVARNEWKYVAEVETDFDDAISGVACFPGDLNQVVLNIIVNAAHAIAGVVGDGADGKGTIRVTTRRSGQWVEIRISDSGTGIPHDVQPRIFDPFFTTKEVGKGTGQGLALAYSIVTEKHGGTLTFETEAGKGTTFVIRLPHGVASDVKES